MEKKRIKKDLCITWKNIKTNGELISLVGRDIRLELTDPRGRKKFIAHEVVNEYDVQFKMAGAEQEYLGVYKLSLWENYNAPGVSVLDTNAVQLVADTAEETDGTDADLGIDSLDLEGGNIDVGFYGPSNYELAVKHGFVGTEEEYLASLHGKDFTYDDFTPEQIEVLQKPANDAAVKADEATKRAHAAAKKAEDAAAMIPETIYTSDTKEYNDMFN